MQKNYKQLAESIRARLEPGDLYVQKNFSEKVASVSYSDVLVFVRASMMSVPPEYTQKTKEAGDRAQEHLTRALQSVQYRYQGSVMTNTHIYGYSDIDLLVISDEFYGWDKSHVEGIIADPIRRERYRDNTIAKLVNETKLSPFNGSIEKLSTIRDTCEITLSQKYQQCDTSKSKSIQIYNSSLNRSVDVVVSNWYDDVTSIINDKGDYRGIQVFDKAARKRLPADYPFISIQRINRRSSKTQGRLKRMIRFLKNVKSQSDHEIKMSSFDINAICYEIEPSNYENSNLYDLVAIALRQISELAGDENRSNQLKSVDGREYIFRNHPEKLKGLVLLMHEVHTIYCDLKDFLPAVR